MPGESCVRGFIGKSFLGCWPVAHIHAASLHYNVVCRIGKESSMARAGMMYTLLNVVGRTNTPASQKMRLSQ